MIGAFAGFAAIRKLREWAGEAIKNAQQVRDEMEKIGRPVDNATRTLANFGDGLADVKKLAVDSVGYLVGGYTQLGDLIGSGINRLRGISEAQENMAMQGVRALAEEQKAIAKAREENSPDKLAAAEQKLKAAKEATALAALSGQDRLNRLLLEQKEIQKDIDSHAINTVDHINAQVAMEGKLKEIQEQKAKIADDELKAQDQHNNILKEISREEDNIRKIKLDQLPLDQQIIALKKEESEQIKLVKFYGDADKLDGSDKLRALQAQEKLLTIQNEIRSKNLEVTKQQAQAEKSTTDAMKQQLSTLAGIAGIRTSAQFGNASEQELKELLRRDRAAADRLKNPALTHANLGTQMETARLEVEAQNVAREINLRDTTRGNIGRYGMEGARRMFQGDPLAFDRFVQQIDRGAKIDDQQLTELREIKRAVQGKFKNQ